MIPTQVDAPFEMPAIRCPDFSGCPRFPITDAGAKPGDQARTSRAIASAIDRAHAAGGGVVVIPQGDWLTGKVHLKSNVCLELAEGAVLEFSHDPADYLPPVMTTWEGMECYSYSPLIYAFECRNIAITGRGTLRARLDTWRQWYGRPEPHLQALKKLYEMASYDVPVGQRQMVGDDANLRPHFIQFNRCESVLVEGVTIRDSPFWVIHPYLSRHIVIRGVTVKAHGHNNDGVDIDMSQCVLVEDCDFDQGDDVIVIKSGRNRDAWRLDTPSKQIVVRNCVVRHGHHLLAIGTELSGGVEDVLVEDCQLDESIDTVGHLMYLKTNHRRGGYARNIYLRRVTSGGLRDGVLGIETDVLYQWKDLVPTYEERLTPIEGIYIESIRTGGVRYVARIDGQQALPVGPVVMRGIETGRVSESVVQLRHAASFDWLPTGGRAAGPSLHWSPES